MREMRVAFVYKAFIYAAKSQLDSCRAAEVRQSEKGVSLVGNVPFNCCTRDLVMFLDTSKLQVVSCLIF